EQHAESARIAQPGAGGLTAFSIARGRSWSPMEFPNMTAAIRFEKYLKSGSGRALTKRQLGCRTLEARKMTEKPKVKLALNNGVAAWEFEELSRRFATSSASTAGHRGKNSDRR